VADPRSRPRAGAAPGDGRGAVHEIVQQMLREARRGGPVELRDMAVRLGIDPASPGDVPPAGVSG